MVDNILQQVQTYQPAIDGFLLNTGSLVKNANKIFENYQNLKGNLGSTVNFQLHTRRASVPGLSVPSSGFQATQQRVQSLTTDQSETCAYQFDDPERIYNVEQYMDEFGKAAAYEIGTKVESNVAGNFLSHTYRAFGDGRTDITSYKQLAQALTNFKNYGSQQRDLCIVIPDVKSPDIIDNGFSQFVTNRNNEANEMWQIGSIAGTPVYTSNLLKTHEAGTAGTQDQELTVVSINADGTQLTLSGATASDSDAIKLNDKLTFDATNNIRFTTFIGHQRSAQLVQVRATADAGADSSGNVVVNIFPALNSTAGDQNQSVTTAPTAGMTLSVSNTRIAGGIYYKPSLLLAMPRLPMKTPFPTSNMMDETLGVSTRMYYGASFNDETMGWVHSCLWGSTLVDEDAMELSFTAT